MFFVGQKVVCVDAEGPDQDDYWAPWEDGEAVSVDNIYTVTSCHLDHAGCEVVHLHEVRRCEEAVETYGPFVGYGAWRFRPLTDISIFTDMLKREPRHDLVDA